MFFVENHNMFEDTDTFITRFYHEFFVLSNEYTKFLK